MARKLPVSFVAGDTANARRMLAAGGVDNGAPTLPQQGFACGGYETIELVLSAATSGGGTTYRARVFWLNNAAETWVRDVVVGNQTISTTEPTSLVLATGGASRVYVHVDTFGAGVTESVWGSGLPV